MGGMVGGGGALPAILIPGLEHVGEDGPVRATPHQCRSPSLLRYQDCLTAEESEGPVWLSSSNKGHATHMNPAVVHCPGGRGLSGAKKGCPASASGSIGAFFPSPFTLLWPCPRGWVALAGL